MEKNLLSIIEEIESYTRMVKFKRRDKVSIFKEIAFLATKASKLLEEK